MSVLINSEDCTGCGSCASVCPVQAISIIQNKAIVDQNRCNECLQCIDECPVNAIYQISEKEVYVAEKKNSIPYSLNRTVAHTKQILSNNKRKQQAVEKGRMFLNEVKKAMDNFFKVDSSFGITKKGRRMKHRRQRRRHKGGRF